MTLLSFAQATSNPLLFRRNQKHTEVISLSKQALGNWDHEVDFLVVGSGGGGMTAAITAHHHGLRTLVIEKSPVYGGTTALSGGVIWIPNNHLMPLANVRDSAEEAMRYLEQVVSADVPRERLQAYVEYGPAMLKFLEENSLVKFDPAPVYPDYYAELDGGKSGARSLDPRPYSIRELGEELHSVMRQSELVHNNTFSMTASEAHEIFSFTWRSHVVIFKRLLSYWLDIPSRLKKLPDNRLTLGKALVARLRHSMEKQQIPLWLSTPLKEIVMEEGKVIGVIVEQEGRLLHVKTNKGVLIAAGGFAYNYDMRQRYHRKPTGTTWTAASHADTGDGILLGQQAGAQIGMMGYAWWTPTLVLPNNVVEAFIVGKSMPSCMMVNQKGQRILNEAEPYEDFVKHQYESNDNAPSIPAWFVFDARYRHEYPLGTAMAPGKYMGDSLYKELFESGWIKKSDTVSGLAEQCGIDAEELENTFARMTEFAWKGCDEDFGKGNTLNDKYYSDHRISPNPCLAPLDKPPFYAVQIWPGDLGTKGGLVADEYARVLDKNNQVIPGLYVTGNSSASVMGDSYPGAGSTIGPSMTFGYIAAKHAAEVKE